MQAQIDQSMVNGKNPQVTKVDRYGWTVKDAPGKYIQIDKRDLYIDRAYQREVRPRKIMQMARDWSWVACGALIVIQRDGRYYVVDGQHRKMAADKRSDIKKIPCLLFDLDDIRCEADTFLTVNSMRTGLRMLEKVPARLTRGDSVIVELAEMLESTGHVFDQAKSSLKSVQFISTLEESYSINKELTKRVWPIFIDILSGERATHQIWEGLFYLFQRVDMTPHVKNLKKAGKQKMMQEIYKAKVFYAKGGPKVYAEGLKNIINYGKKIRVQDLPANPINNRQNGASHGDN